MCLQSGQSSLQVKEAVAALAKADLAGLEDFRSQLLQWHATEGQDLCDTLDVVFGAALGKPLVMYAQKQVSGPPMHANIHTCFITSTHLPPCMARTHAVPLQ